MALLYDLWIEYFEIHNTRKIFINIFNMLTINSELKNSTTWKGALYEVAVVSP